MESGGRVAAVVLAAAGLANLGMAPPAGAAGEPVIAVFTKNATNPAYEAFRIGSDQIARAVGARTVHYVPQKPDDVGEQTAMVEQALKARPDIVLFVPVDDKAMVEPVKKLNDAKIPVVLFTNPLPGQFVAYVGADDVAIGEKQARYLFDKLGGKGRIVIIEGQPQAPTNRDRLRGYQKALAEYPGITVLGSAIGNYQRPNGKTAMAGLLARHGEIDAVLAANDDMAIGALAALKEANRTSVVMGINGILDAVKLIESGEILASVDFNMFKIGCMAARAAARHLKNEPVPERIIMPADVIDKANYRDWLLPVNQRTCPEWTDVVREGRTQ